MKSLGKTHAPYHGLESFLKGPGSTVRCFFLELVHIFVNNRNKYAPSLAHLSCFLFKSNCARGTPGARNFAAFFFFFIIENMIIDLVILFQEFEDKMYRLDLHQLTYMCMDTLKFGPEQEVWWVVFGDRARSNWEARSNCRPEGG